MTVPTGHIDLPPYDKQPSELGNLVEELQLAVKEADEALKRAERPSVPGGEGVVQLQALLAIVYELRAARLQNALIHVSQGPGR